MASRPLNCYNRLMISDPIIDRASAAIKALYGDRLDRLVLFGSRARGDAGADADYDIAVFLKGAFDRWAENDRLLPLTVDFLTPENNYSIIQAIPFPAATYAERRLPIMHEIRREGVAL